MPPSKRRVIGVIVALTMLVLAGGYITWRMHVMGRRGWTGISYVAVFSDREIQAQKNVPMMAFKPGAVVMVYPDSPADRQGVRIGDRIVAVNGISIEKIQEMGTVSARAKFGDVLAYRVERNGRMTDYRIAMSWPLSSPVFVVLMAITLSVALTFVVTGVFVFWRLPADPRATVFLALTLVALLSFATTATVYVETQFRGVQGPPSAMRDFATPAILAASSIFLAPLLLHLALIFPKNRPVVARRPTLFRWIYGAPIYLSICMFGGVLVSSVALMLDHQPQNEWIIKLLFRGIGYGTLLLSVVSMVPLFLVARRTHSTKETVIARPVLTLNLILGVVMTIFWLAGVAMKETRSPAVIMLVVLGIIFLCVLGLAVYPIGTIVSLYRSYRESGPEERRQVKWPLWGTIVAAGGKVALAVVAVGISLLIFSGRTGIPSILMLLPTALAQVLYILIPLSFAFAILKYRLMNIDVIIRRTVLYTILSAVVFVLYGVLVASLGTLLIRFAHVQNTTMVIASTIVVALVAVPLRNRLQQMVDRNLFRERRDYPLALRNIGNAIGGGDMEAFLRYAAEQLQHALQTRFVAVALRSDEHFVISAKVGIADDVVGRIRIPADTIRFDRIPEELRKLGAAMVVPVSVHREPLGLVAAGSKLSDQELTDDDREFLTAAASQLALGLENSRLRTEEAEFAQARAIQQVLLPAHFPRLDGFEITGRAQPARSVGGDYFDTLALGEGKVAICIGDVAGKGMPAALLMANLQAAVKATAGPDVSPSRLCEKVKRVVGDNLSGGKFISFFYGVIDSAARTLTYTNAGHNPPILVRAGGAVERLMTGGPTFCRLFREDPHHEGAVALAPGDRLVLFTDGASEARRGEDEFGEDHLAEFIAANRGAGAQALQQAIVEELTAFTSGNFSDDVTLVVVAAV
jgi:serine phosphatase RsbU (regulator of sigma subunit)